MLRRLPALLALCTASLLAACRPPEPPRPVLTDRQVPLGQATSTEVRADFAGEWQVEARPDWLRVSRSRGEGPVAFTITADRSAATPLAADRPTLSGDVVVGWTDVRGETGQATFTVTAEQFVLTGQVLDTARITALDAATGGPDGGAAGEARGVLVKYRAAGGGVRAQGLEGPGGSSAAERGAGTLRAAGLRVAGGRDVAPGLAALSVGDLPGALRTLRADPAVEYAVPNAALRAQAVPLALPVEPTDQYAGLQWPFRLLGYPAVWRDMALTPYIRPVTVAVLDSGVRYDHPDLAGRLWGPGEGALDVLPQFVDSGGKVGNGDGDGADTDPTDPSTPGRTYGSHGTHVTGLIVAGWGQFTPACDGCTDSGVVGASHTANVKVLPVRIIDARGDTDVAQVIAGVRYAAGLPVTLDGQTFTNPHPAQVINLSLGGDISADTARPMCEAVQAATERGALVVVASGNGYGTVPYYPAACSGAVAVGSVTLSGGSAPVRAPYSNAYPEVLLSAPGGTDPLRSPTAYNGAELNGEPFLDLVFSTGWDYEQDEPNYVAESGTSQAAPQVSALAALLLSKGVTTDRAGTLARLVATATDLGAPGRDDVFGAGMINAAAALGAPAISDTLGLRLQSERGQAFQPPLDALGRFWAYLGDGTYVATGGRDRDANGLYGETHEPRDQRTATLSPGRPRVDLGELRPQ